jgi:hypothetical protein
MPLQLDRHYTGMGQFSAQLRKLLFAIIDADNLATKFCDEYRFLVTVVH